MEHAIHKLPNNPHEHHLTDHELADKIAHTSPDGRPAEPVLRKRGMYWMLTGVALLVIAGGTLTWIFTGDTPLAIAVTGFVLLGGILSSPALISAILRAREREEAEHEVDTTPTPTPTPASNPSQPPDAPQVYEDPETR